MGARGLRQIGGHQDGGWGNAYGGGGGGGWGSRAPRKAAQAGRGGGGGKRLNIWNEGWHSAYQRVKVLTDDWEGRKIEGTKSGGGGGVRREREGWGGGEVPPAKNSDPRKKPDGADQRR